MARPPRSFLTVGLATLSLLVGGAGANTGAAQTGCHPILSGAEFDGAVPTAEEILGFPLGTEEVSVQESDAYLRAVDEASDRVTSGTTGASVEGRPLTYAIVGAPEHVTPDGLTGVRGSIDALRDPSTPGTVAADLAATTPAILLVQANVHGGEESGTESSLRLLYELADRVDCVAETVLENALVVILPVQNPDGRAADARRNHYGIDLNRDWFARTQPETDGKLELLRQYPPVLDLDVHEMGAFTYFFPPNSDPVYHEIADESVGWINGIYGPAMAAEFERQKIRFFNFEPYDLFGTFYGDTVPTVGFHAAGMTFEKYSGDPLDQRLHEQYVTSIVSVFEAASNKDEILRQWHRSWVEAFQEGLAGKLEPNAVYQRGHRVIEEAPRGAFVRHYFLLEDEAKAYEVQRLVRRLQRMDVEVFRLAEPLRVPDFRAHGRPAVETTLPTGTYWIPMAQAHKHWIQAMLHEDTYIPHDVTYDVTGWSNPLLMNVPAGFSASSLDPVGTRVEAVGEPSWPLGTPGAPAVALFDGPGNTALESAGAVEWLFTEVWDLPFTWVSGSDVAAGALHDHDVLVMPDAYAQSSLQSLGARGKKAIVGWVNDGGRLIAWEGGAEVVTRIGASTAVLQLAHTTMPGSLVRGAVDTDSPLADGVGPFAWAMFEDDPVMQPGRGRAVMRFPDAGSQDFFVSGLDIGAEQLGGTAAIVDEPVGTGRAIVFSFDPAFRGWAEGTQRILWNAIAGPDPFAGVAARAGSAERAQDERAARSASERLPRLSAPFRLTVAAADAAATVGVLSELGVRWAQAKSAGGTLFLIANPKELSAEEHPFIGSLPTRLAAAGVRLRSLSLR